MPNWRQVAEAPQYLYVGRGKIGSYECRVKSFSEQDVNGNGIKPEIDDAGKAKKRRMRYNPNFKWGSLSAKKVSLQGEVVVAPPSRVRRRKKKIWKRRRRPTPESPPSSTPHI